jgi:hypothetical protein
MNGHACGCKRLGLQVIEVQVNERPPGQLGDQGSINEAGDMRGRTGGQQRCSPAVVFARVHRG